MEYTLTPWENDNTRKYYNDHVIRHNGQTVATIHKTITHTQTEVDANARLIAAAPAMYEALKAQLDAFNRIQKLCPTMFNILIPEQKKAWEIMQDACIKSEQALYQAENK